MDANVEARLDDIESVFAETEAMLSDPEAHADLPRLADLGRKHSELSDLVSDIRRWRQASADLAEAEEMSDDPDMATLAGDLSKEIESLEERIRAALVPTDPNDAKDVIVEIRSAAGGDEAANPGPGTCCACTSDTPIATGSVSKQWSPRLPKPVAMTRSRWQSKAAVPIPG